VLYETTYESDQLAEPFLGLEKDHDHERTL